MRSHLTISVCLVTALFVSSGNVMAQTGEFTAAIPGSVVHAGYGLQDWLQDLRNGVREPPPAPQTVQAPIELFPPPPPPPVKPKKTAKKVTTASQVQPKQPQ
jgi:hypothetical protein